MSKERTRFFEKNFTFVFLLNACREFKNSIVCISDCKT